MSETFIVTRRVGRFSFAMYLTGWDVIWGPCWSMTPASAMRFADAAGASEAIDTAVACTRPVPWRVPDFFSTSTYSAEALS